MSKIGLVLFLFGLLAELPQGLASMGVVGVIHFGNLPGNEMTKEMACVGFALCAFGLYRIALSKRHQGWVAGLGVLGIPGALVGLTVVALLKAK